MEMVITNIINSPINNYFTSEMQIKHLRSIFLKKSFEKLLIKTT